MTANYDHISLNIVEKRRKTVRELEEEPSSVYDTIADLRRRHGEAQNRRELRRRGRIAEAPPRSIHTTAYGSDRPQTGEMSVMAAKTLRT